MALVLAVVRSDDDDDEKGTGVLRFGSRRGFLDDEDEDDDRGVARRVKGESNVTFVVRRGRGTRGVKKEGGSSAADGGGGGGVGVRESDHFAST